MSSQYPASHSTPIHPRLAELAANAKAEAASSPFSTPDSAVTASSYDKTALTPGIASESENNFDADSSGESLGIRARRSGSSGFIDAQESPQTHNDSNLSRNTATSSMTGKSETTSTKEASHEYALSESPSSSALALQLARSNLLGPDHAGPDENQPGAEQPASTAASTINQPVKDAVKDIHFISARSVGAASGAASAGNIYSPPPPPQAGNAFLKRGAGDYYSDGGGASIPSPKLESSPEVSGEVSKHKTAMIETPLRHNSALRHSALAGRRPTCVDSIIACHGHLTLRLNHYADTYRFSPYAASLLQDMLDSTNSLTESSGKLSTPNNRSGASLNDSMFESPLLAPMAPYGSPIRFSTVGTLLGQPAPGDPSPIMKSPTSLHISKRLAIRKPPALDAPSPLKREEAKIRDILWTTPAEDEDDPADVDILPPEVEHLGPPSPYASHFSAAVTASRDDKSEGHDQAPAGAENSREAASQPPALKRVRSQPGPNGNLNKIPTLVGPNSLPYARCPSYVSFSRPVSSMFLRFTVPQWHRLFRFRPSKSATLRHSYASAARKEYTQVRQLR